MKTEKAPMLESTSECAWCGEPITYTDPDGWIHPALVGIGVLGGDGICCDITPVATPGAEVIPPAKETR